MTEPGEQPKGPEELGPQDVAETQAAAGRWATWARHDFTYFVDPLAAQAGLTREEALLYILSERLGELLESGLLMHVVVHQPPPEDEGESWKRGRK